jgi:hypothetical protein
VCESRLLRKIFGATRVKIEVRGDQNGLHYDTIYNLYSSFNFLGDQSTKDGMSCACGTYSGEKGCIQGSVGKSKRKRELGMYKIHVCCL